MAALDEICVVFTQRGDDAADLLMKARHLRGLHTQFDDDTSLPFPLHELRLLGGDFVQLFCRRVHAKPSRDAVDLHVLRKHKNGPVPLKK